MRQIAKPEMHRKFRGRKPQCICRAWIARMICWADGFLSISYMENSRWPDAIGIVVSGGCSTGGKFAGSTGTDRQRQRRLCDGGHLWKDGGKRRGSTSGTALNSACFYFSELDGKIRILTKGIGHGLGLSQYGANELAKQGKNYQDILKYYYQDVTLEYW